MEIYGFNISQNTKADYKAFKEIVSIERRKKTEKYRLYDDSVRSIYAEIILRYVLKEKYGKSANIAYTTYGKPYLYGEKELFFNISHSGNWVIMAIGLTEVGVDIEKIDEKNTSYLMDVFTKDEKFYISIGTKKQQIEKMFLMWTLKESYVKYLGTGMFTNFTDFTIDLSKGVVRNRRNGIVDNQICFNSSVIDTEYCLSVCSTDKKIYIKEIKIDELRNILL